jgi:tRNA threonylcarbamoyladenosine biosynthesis protein TsaB
LPAKRRPPERTWWAQVVTAGTGEGEPVEADEVQLRQMLAGVSAVAGEGLDGVELGLSIAPARPSALAAARIVARRAEAGLVPPVPIYVREPDAAPMTKIIPGA